MHHPIASIKMTYPRRERKIRIAPLGIRGMTAKATEKEDVAATEASRVSTKVAATVKP